MNRPNLFALLCVLMLAWLPVSAQEYSNPVKPGSHPGSSVCRAGDKWVHLQNSIPDNYLCNDTMAVGKKYLMRLYPHGSLTENQLPTFAGRLQECASFTLETEVVTKGNVEAGLSVADTINRESRLHISLGCYQGKCGGGTLGLSCQRRAFRLFRIQEAGGFALQAEEHRLCGEERASPAQGFGETAHQKQWRDVFLRLFARWKAIPRVGFHELQPDEHRGGRRIHGRYAGHVCRRKAKERSC